MERNHLVKVTQYLRPEGRKCVRFAPVTEEYYSKAMSVINKGGYFEAEVLTTGHVSLTAGYQEEDIAIEVVNNGPDVETALDKVIDRAMKHLEDIV